MLPLPCIEPREHFLHNQWEADFHVQCCIKVTWISARLISFDLQGWIARLSVSFFISHPFSPFLHLFLLQKPLGSCE